MDYSTIAASYIKLLSLLTSACRSDHLASIETVKKCVYWMNSLWKSLCVSIMLFLDYFYSYNSNASLKITPVVILHMFSAEHDVTVVLSLSLQKHRLNLDRAGLSNGSYISPSL